MMGTGEEDEAAGPNSLSLSVQTQSNNNEAGLMNVQLGVQAGGGGEICHRAFLQPPR